MDFVLQFGRGFGKRLPRGVSALECVLGKGAEGVVVGARRAVDLDGGRLVERRQGFLGQPGSELDRPQRHHCRDQVICSSMNAAIDPQHRFARPFLIAKCGDRRREVRQ